MHDLHIVDFYNDTGRMLVSLYMRFPVRSALYIEDISGPDTPDEYGLHSARHVACFGAALWLAEEGYFRYSQPIQQEALDEAVLTQEAFLFFTSFDAPNSVSRITQIKQLIDDKNALLLGRYLHTTFKGFVQFRKNHAEIEN